MKSTPPSQYLLGYLEFFDCEIAVDPAVLIPRQETEILVSKIVDDLNKENLTGKVLWDVCCGSGCIGIAIKKKIPQLKVVLSDVSAAAVDVARKNAKANSVEVEIVQGDLLSPFSGQKTDYLVCNPPYITEEEFPNLDPMVRDHEPKIALVGGKTGLEFYERLKEELPGYLNPGAKAWMEMGTGQGKAIVQLFLGPPWKSARHEKDWSGHDRFFFLEIE